MRKFIYLFAIILFSGPNLLGLEFSNPKVKQGASVAIIGGGPAGIHCARLLKENKYKVKVFEKSSKAAPNVKKFGRVMTLNLDGGGVSEMGPIKVGPRHRYTQAYLKDLGIEVFEPADSSIIRQGAHYGTHRILRPHEEFFPYGKRMDIVREAINYELWQRDYFSRYPNMEDSPDDEESNQSFVELLAKKNLQYIHHMSKIYISAYGYGTPEDMPTFKAARLLPALGMLLWVNTDQKPKMIGVGFGGFLQAMVDRYQIEINYGQKISQIYRAEEGVYITLEEGTVERFDKLIITCPIDKVIHLLRDGGTKIERELSENIHYSIYDTFAVKAEDLPRGGGVFGEYLNNKGKPQMYSKNSPFDSTAIIYVPQHPSMRAMDFVSELEKLPSLEQAKTQMPKDLALYGVGPVNILAAERWYGYNPHFKKARYYRMGAQSQGYNHTFFTGTMLAEIDYVDKAFAQSNKMLNRYFEGYFPEPDQGLFSALEWHLSASNLYDKK